MDEEITSAQYIVSLTLYVPNFLPSLPSQGRSVFFCSCFAGNTDKDCPDRTQERWEMNLDLYYYQSVLVLATTEKSNFSNSELLEKFCWKIL